MEKQSKGKAFFLAVFAYFTIGAMVLTANTVLDPVIREFSWSNGRGALLISFMSAGNVLMSIFGNLLMERIGTNRALQCYAGLIAVMFLLFSMVPVPELYVGFLLVAGLAWGGINNLANTVVSELYDGNASQLNVLHAGYSVAAVIFPLFVGFVTGAGLSWRIPVVAVSVLSVALLVCAFAIRLPDKKNDASKEKQTTENIPYWKEVSFYLFCLTLFFYVGVESAASSWISGYLSRYNTFFEKIPGQTMVALMWGMMLVGRLSVAAISTKINKRTMLIVLSGCFLLGMVGLVAFCYSTPLVILSVAVMGLGMSALYGTTVANAKRYVTGPALGAGLIYSFGGFGSTLVPFLAGLVSDASGLRAGMASLCFCLAALFVIIILNRRTPGQETTAN